MFSVLPSFKPGQVSNWDNGTAITNDPIPQVLISNFGKYMNVFTIFASICFPHTCTGNYTCISLLANTSSVFALQRSQQLTICNSIILLGV